MVAYNHGDFIEKAIESIMMQNSNFNYKLFIGEDNSTDKTRVICQSLKEKYPNKIELILHEKNIGSNPNGIFMYQKCLESGAKYIALCEGDDYWTDPYKLQKQVDFLEANPEYILSFHDAIIIGPDNQLLSSSYLSEENRIDLEQSDLKLNYRYVPTLTWCFRGHILNEILNSKQLPKAVLGDMYLLSILGNFGKAKYQSDIEIGAVHRFHNGGVWSLKTQAKRLKMYHSLCFQLEKYYKTSRDSAAQEHYKRLRLETIEKLLYCSVVERNNILILKSCFYYLIQLKVIIKPKKLFLLFKTVLKYLISSKTISEKVNILSKEEQFFSQRPKNYDSIKLFWDKIPLYCVDYYVYERYLMKYSNVFATEHGVLFTKKKVFKETFIFNDHVKNYTPKFYRKLLKQRSVLKISGKNNIVLYNYWSSNYFHWLIDDLPRLDAILNNVPNSPPVIVYIPDSAPQFVFDSLSHFNVSIFKFKLSNVLHFEEVMYCNTLSPSGFVHPNVKLLQNKFNLITEAKSDNSIVYISRKNSAVRFISNENKFIAALNNIGVHIVHTEKLSLFEQMSIFSKARIVISTHGAGLTNSIFMNGGSVIEIGSTDTNDHPNCFSNLASILNLDYYYIPIEYDKKKLHYTISNDEIELIIDIIKSEISLKT